MSTMTHEQAMRWVGLQRQWIEYCGGTLEAYIERYGTAEQPKHGSEGGPAIYAADQALLAEYEREALVGR